MHERDGLTDFLLTKLKDVLHKMPSLKLILSSAALDVSLFARYFKACPVVYSKRFKIYFHLYLMLPVTLMFVVAFEVKGCPYDVKRLYLEDILRTTGYKNKEMKKYSKDVQKGIVNQ